MLKYIFYIQYTCHSLYNMLASQCFIKTNLINTTNLKFTRHSLHYQLHFRNKVLNLFHIETNEKCLNVSIL